MHENNGFVKSQNVLKWLRLLFYVHIASLVVSVITHIPIFATLAVWISRLLTVGVIVCLFRLAPANIRYRKAAVFRTVLFGCSVLTAFGLAASVFTFAGSICSLISIYQEYTGHSEMMNDLDAKLSGKWHTLFLWQIVVGVLSAFASMVATLFVVMLWMETTLAVVVNAGIIGVAGIIVEIIYLKYLNRMCCLIGNTDESIQ